MEQDRDEDESDFNHHKKGKVVDNIDTQLVRPNAHRSQRIDCKVNYQKRTYGNETG